MPGQRHRRPGVTTVMEPRAYIEEGEAIGPCVGVVHRLLDVDRRRLALEVIAERGPTGLDALVEEVVRREADAEVPEHSGAPRRCASTGYADTDGSGHVDAVVSDDVDADGRRRDRPDR